MPLTFILIILLVFHHPFTLSFQASNLLFLQTFPLLPSFSSFSGLITWITRTATLSDVYNCHAHAVTVIVDDEDDDDDVDGCVSATQGPRGEPGVNGIDGRHGQPGLPGSQVSRGHFKLYAL